MPVFFFFTKTIIPFLHCIQLTSFLQKLTTPRKAPSQGDRFAMLRAKPPMAGKPGSRDLSHQPPQPPQSPPPEIPDNDPPHSLPKDKNGSQREPNEWDLDLSQNSGF